MREFLIKRGSFVLMMVGILLLAFTTAYAAPGLLADIIEKSDKTIRLETMTSGLTAPNFGIFAPGDDDRLYVSDQDGTLWVIDLSDGSKSVFADLSSLLVPLGAFGPGTFDERGFLGLAFHPDYNSNGVLYTYTSEPVDGEADFSTIPPDATANHQAVVREWQVPDPGNPASVVDPTSSRVLLRIDMPQFNHNGGALNFGSDGMLYIALGDGGGRDDEGTGHSPQGNAQDPSNPLGSILRINPQGTNSVNGQYGIPADNPFVGMNGYVEEIFAYGFRNPFRFSFDMKTGDLYTGDVGQNDLEEVDVVVAGGNYGWNVMEGSFCFDPNGELPGFAYDQVPCPNEPPGLIDPVAEYNTSDSLAENEDGRAVVGGFVYRGNAIPGLVGRYIFGDFSQFTESRINNEGRLFFLNKKNIVNGDRIKTSKIFEFTLYGQDALGLSLLGFG